MQEQKKNPKQQAKRVIEMHLPTTLRRRRLCWLHFLGAAAATVSTFEKERGETIFLSFIHFMWVSLNLWVVSCQGNDLLPLHFPSNWSLTGHVSVVTSSMMTQRLLHHTFWEFYATMFNFTQHTNVVFQPSQKIVPHKIFTRCSNFCAEEAWLYLKTSDALLVHRGDTNLLWQTPHRIITADFSNLQATAEKK